MKILFTALHFGYFRNFESVVCALAERDHTIHLAADEPESLGGQQLVERLAATYPGITWGWAPSLEEQPWFRLARKLRIALDYVRFHGPEYEAFQKPRRHLADRVPRALLRSLELPVVNNRVGRYLLAGCLHAFERIVPTSAAIDEFVRAHEPDLVLLASITSWRAPQLDHLKSARALGIKTGVCVWSWDHLSSKALIRELPDRVFVWNETQKQEALQLHRIPADRIVLTGAQCYDQWFDRQPSGSREEFCHRVGLPHDRPILLYVCSVLSPDPRESTFVLRWIERVRTSYDPVLREAGILIRPHPERMEEWTHVDLGALRHVALHGRNPVSAESKADYFDALYHSAAVVGVITSAFLEAAIVGRPVFTLLLSELRAYQEGMIHFRYLLEVEGGVLRVARTFEEHLGQLSAVLPGPWVRDEQNRRFLQAFVRPRGLDVQATPEFIAAIEDLGRLAPAAPQAATARVRFEFLVHRLAASAEHGWARPLLVDAREIEIEKFEAERARQKEQIVGARRERASVKRQQEILRQRERDRALHLRNRRKKVARLKTRIKELMRLQTN